MTLPNIKFGLGNESHLTDVFSIEILDSGKMYFKLKHKSIVSFEGHRLESDRISLYFTLKTNGEEMIFGVNKFTKHDGVQITQYDHW